MALSRKITRPSVRMVEPLPTNDKDFLWIKGEGATPDLAEADFCNKVAKAMSRALNENWRDIEFTSPPHRAENLEQTVFYVRACLVYELWGNYLKRAMSN